MGTGVCEICGRTVLLSAFDTCYACRGQRERQYEKVLEYLKGHPGSNIDLIAAATGVEPKLVLKLLQKGSLKVAKDAYKPKCQSCGRPVDSGRFCRDCARSAKPKK